MSATEVAAAEPEEADLDEGWLREESPHAPSTSRASAESTIGIREYMADYPVVMEWRRGVYAGSGIIVEFR